MKKFCLVKEYPGSPDKGTITTEFLIYPGDNNISWWYLTNENLRKILDIKPEKYPDFWKEIVEKDYEILSFKTNLEKYSLKSDDKYVSNSHGIICTLDQLLTNAVSKIHSIKRLSDGEIFTIGDKILSYNTIKTIKKINISISDPLDVGFTTDGDGYKGSDYQFLFEDNVKKVKQPLFTTTDGVDIFEGDTFYWLDKGLNLLNSGYSKNVGTTHNTLYFSTKEKAEEYVKFNKPQYSISDVMVAYQQAYAGGGTRKLVLIDELTKLKK